eukprot:5095979-Lingulodinium_polyedra.AAC.1
MGDFTDSFVAGENEEVGVGRFAMQVGKEGRVIQKVRRELMGVHMLAAPGTRWWTGPTYFGSR